MDPIQDIGDLCSGDVVHHPALGFAVVDKVEDGSARLAWETNGARLPPLVSSELLAKGYRRCIPGGFLHRSVTDHGRLKGLIENEPTSAIRLLLDDLGTTQGRSEIRDWMTGRALLSTVQFDRWWTSLEDASDEADFLNWSDDRRALSLTKEPESDDPEAFLAAAPRARWGIAQGVDSDTRNRLLHQAITARDTDAILIVLRLQETIPDSTRDALRQLARKGDSAVAAALLDRGDSDLLKSFVSPSAHAVGQERVLSVLNKLTPTRRNQIAVAIIDRALAIEGDPPAAGWLCTITEGGAESLLEAAFELKGFEQAIEWLETRIEGATLGDNDSTLKTRDTIEFTSPFGHNTTAQLISNLRDIASDRILPLSVSLAQALAERHAQGEAGGVNGARIDATGKVTLGPEENRSPRDDVRDAMRLVLEAAVGPLPADVPLSDAELLPHINQLRPDLPLDWLATLTEALAENPKLRPVDGLVLWAGLTRAQATHKIRTMGPRSLQVDLQVAHDTHIGLQKSRVMQTNQDAVFHAKSGNVSVLVVADGISVSTAGSGNLASALLVQVISNLWDRDVEHLQMCESEAVVTWIREALVSVNRAICDASSQLVDGDLSQQIPMGTTALLGVVRGGMLHLGCLGDSRAYVVGTSGVALLSGDQNVRGLYLCASKAGHQLPNVAEEGYALVGYCGRFDEQFEPAPAEPVIRSVRLLPNETLLLCSDGFTDYAAGAMGELAKIIANHASNPDLTRGCQALVNAANEGGGGDNITVLLARLCTD